MPCKISDSEPSYSLLSSFHQEFLKLWVYLAISIIHLTKNYRFDTKSKKDLTTAMEQFVQAADALLDGVVSLNDSNEIIWCNKRAQLMFGIHPKKDLSKPIQHIFRNSEFKKYLDRDD